MVTNLFILGANSANILLHSLLFFRSVVLQVASRDTTPMHINTLLI